MKQTAGIKRITVNLPEQLIKKACEITGHGITQTLCEGLERIYRSLALEKVSKLKGKLNLDIDLEASRERDRR